MGLKDTPTHFEMPFRHLSAGMNACPQAARHARSGVQRMSEYIWNSRDVTQVARRQALMFAAAAGCITSTHESSSHVVETRWRRGIQKTDDECNKTTSEQRRMTQPLRKLLELQTGRLSYKIVYIQSFCFQPGGRSTNGARVSNRYALKSRAAVCHVRGGDDLPR